jgi:hypothetical protein
MNELASGFARKRNGWKTSNEIWVTILTSSSIVVAGDLAIELL